MIRNWFLSLALLLPIASFAGTINGQLQTPTGGPVANATLTFTLSQPAILAGTASIVPSTVSCYTSAAGNVVGLPDPLTYPVLATNTASGTLPAGTYYVKIAYTGTPGDSIASPEATVVLSATGTVIVTAPTVQPASATGYKVYIGSTSGSETLQGTVTGWANYSQSAALGAGASAPSTNASACSIRFSDELIPTGTFYTVNLVSKTASQYAGYPQTWCTYGGSGGTINVSQGAPTGNCGTTGVYYPTPILATPPAGAGAPQAINGPLSATEFDGVFVGALSGDVTSTGTSKLTNANGIRYADYGYGGADACGKINAASLGISPGGILYATGFIGAQACSSAPLSGSPSSGGILQLGLTTYQATATWNVVQNWQIRGVGLGGTKIQAASVGANPVVTLASGVPGAEGTGIENLQVDCAARTGLIGVQNQNAQELSEIRRVTVTDCPNIGIDLETSSAQNTGIYDSQVYYSSSIPTSASAATIPVKINVNGPMRGIRGLTVNATGQTTPPNVGILINSQGTYEDIHCEGAVTCISITSSDVIVHDVQCSSNVTNCISLGTNVQNVIIEGVTSAGTNILVDSSNGNTLTSISDPSGVGWYVTGSSGGPPGACSSSVNVTCKVFPSMIMSGSFTAGSVTSNGALSATGLTSANGGIKAGASGSTISDTRELIQSAHSCGTTTTCANTANGSNRTVFGTVALTSGTPSTATITGISPAFASSSSYVCTATNQTTQGNALKVANVSGSSFTITGPNTVTDTVGYQCIGN